MTVEELLAREEIRQVMARYNMGGDSGRREEFASVFTDEAVLTTTGLHLEGVENIVNGIFAAVVEERADKLRPKFVRHNLTTSKITFRASDNAVGRTYFVVVTDIGLDHSGVYMDEFRKTKDGWKIARRRVHVEYQAPNGYFSD